MEGSSPFAGDSSGMSTPSDPAALGEFIRTAKTKGVDDSFLVTMLRANGWSERRIYSAFSAYYEEALGMPLPARGGRAESARDAFYYLLAFVTLGIWSVALVWLGDVLIDRLFPSTLDYTYSSMDLRYTVAGQLASLIIAFPIFFFVSRSIVRETEQRPESLESGVRKWLTYIALIVTAITLLGDAVFFLQQFLTGDLTTRFACKALLLFVIAGGIFWYYLGTVRPTLAPPARDRLFGWAAIVVVAAAVVFGFSGIGTPSHQRAVAFDERRVTDLQDLAGDITSAYREHHLLPRRLSEVLPVGAQGANDPASHQPYAYVPLRGSHYRLCAQFDTDTRGAAGNTFWQHPAGSKCYTIDATHGAELTP